MVKTISMNTELIKVGNEERKKFNIAKLDVQTYFEKITRGIYFYHFKKPLDAERKVYSFSLQILDDELNYEEMLHSILPELESDKTTKGIYENPKVFCYKYIIPENSEYFLLYMKFYDSIEVISMYRYQS